MAAMLAAGVGLLPPSSPAGATVSSSASRPHLSGRFVLDQSGRVLITHGLNMVYKRSPYRPDAVGFDADDAAFLRRNGFTSVRLGLIWKAVEPRPGRYDDGYLSHLRDTMTLLNAYGVRTLLDSHQDLYNERFQGEGAPDWAVNDDGLPNQPQAGFPGNYFTNVALNRAFDNFWADAPGPGGVGLQDRYAAMWAHTAAYLRGTPGLLGFDVFNEPWPGTAYPTCAQPAGCPVFDASLQAMTQKVIDAVRRVDQRTPVFYEPNVIFNSGAPSYVQPHGTNLGFSFHDYCVSEDTGVGVGTQPVCDQADGLVWNQAESHLSATGDAPLLTEFGATKDAAMTEHVMALADQHLTGWQFWAYCGCEDPTTTGPGAEQALVLDPAKPPSGANVDQGKLRTLAIPYPTTVAGTPLAWHWDRATRVFTARWSTKRVGAPGSFGGGSVSTVAMPQVALPHGYRVSVRGAQVVSRPDAATLVLRTRPGARVVVLEVTAG